MSALISFEKKIIDKYKELLIDELLLRGVNRIQEDTGHYYTRCW